MLGAGYWMNAKTGKLISVSEHGTEVLGHPETFGLTHKDIDGIVGDNVYNPYDSSKGSVRGKLIVTACKHGWVRVRTNARGEWSLQLFGTSRSAVLAFIKVLGRELGDHATVGVSDFATGHQEVMPYSQLRQALKAGQFVDAGRSGPAVGRDAAAETGDKAVKKDAVPANLPDEQQRQVLRGRIGQQAGIPARDVEESLTQRLLRAIREGITTRRASGTG